MATKRSFADSDSDNEQTLENITKRICREGFIKRHRVACGKLFEELKTQLQAYDEQAARRKIELRNARFAYESIDDLEKRSLKASEWVQDTSIQTYESGLCKLSDGDCYYDRHEGRRSGFTIYYLPGYLEDELRMCDVCLDNAGCNGDSVCDVFYNHFKDIDYDAREYTSVDGDDLRPYRAETKEHRLKRAAGTPDNTDEMEWETWHSGAETDLECVNCKDKMTYDFGASQHHRLAFTGISLCHACFCDVNVRLQVVDRMTK